jgi:hypothetical protein
MLYSDQGKARDAVMRYAALVAGLGGLLMAGVVGHGAPVSGDFVKTFEILPGRSITMVREYKAGERACAIVTGRGLSYLGLYVYDADGNCIARDDRASWQTRDDAAVDWYPPAQQRYAVEVKSLAGYKNAFELAVH